FGLIERNNSSRSVIPDISVSSYIANARLIGEQRYHDIKLLHRKHKSRIKPSPPCVANPS
ncbi:hypothetical protein R8O05_30740, partial [Vibrio sp. 1865]|uniref:hypothetical protein n=1 Tax=Vibrio sp. 1865 TaxID=3074580 RepID=UPI00296655A4